MELVLVSAIAGSMWLWLVTETLSLFQALNFTAVLLAWVIFLIGVIILFLKEKRVSPKTSQARLILTPVDILILISIFFILFAALLLVFFSPPNTWDALTYHMARVAHWAQNGSVVLYPTNILRQDFSNPGFEYFVLHVFLLGRGDAWVNLVQWLAMVLSLMTVAMIAKQFGASMRGQILAALVAATIPMGIVESSSLQGDYVVAFFLCAAVYAQLRWRTDASWVWAIVLGAASGLGILAKGTGIFFILPVLVWLAAGAVFARSRRRWQQAFMVIAMVVLINAGFVLRAVSAFSKQDLVQTTQEGRSVLNERFGPDIFFINVLRNAAIHMGTPSDRLNKMITKGVSFLPARMGINMDEPQATFHGAHFKINKPTRDENATSAGMHFLLILVFFFWVFLAHTASTELRPWALCVLAMIVVFCLAVKWQPWLSRLQLPVFVLVAAGIGVFLEKIKPPVLSTVIVCGLFILAIPYVINAYPRHLLGKKSVFTQTREEQYFSMDKARYANYADISNRLAASGCQDIGLVIGGDDWEYPLWPLLKDRGMRHLRIEHIEIKGPLALISYPLGAFHPCARVLVNGSSVDLK